MPAPSITVEPADRAALERIEAVLAANGLPFRDVRTAPGQFFVARDGTALVGAGGVEPYGSDGLLRSVVITEPNRGQGYGTVLCEALEEYARTEGIKTLYLLTTTASSFFRERGYDAISRDAAPASIRQTTEFATLCPSTAACLRKALRERTEGGAPR